MINLCVLLCGCACLSFSDLFVYGYDVMMLNVLRSCITIKILTWYQRNPKISLCVAKIMLQLQLLEIRVSCLKTLEGKIYSLWNFRYNSRREKAQDMKLWQAKYEIFMYLVCKFQPHMRYTLGDMIPPN